MSSPERGSLRRASRPEDEQRGQLTPPEEKEEDGMSDFSEGMDGDDVSIFSVIHLPIPPDGGWGWVIVLSSFLSNAIVDGLAYSFGVFFLEFDEYFKEGKAKTAWVGSLLTGCYLIVGPIVSALTNKFGCRPVMITGSIFGCIAFLLSTTSPNLNVLMLTYGVLGGIGLGMIYLPAIVSVGYYFERKRAFATGISVCGSGVGTFVFAPLSRKLLDWYGWKGATIILAGFILNCMVFGCLMRPLKPPKTNKKPLLQRMAEEKKLQRDRGSICDSQLFFTVKLADGSSERRPKVVNLEPGVHSSFNLDKFGAPENSPTTTTPLPFPSTTAAVPPGLPPIAENARMNDIPETSRLPYNRSAVALSPALRNLRGNGAMPKNYSSSYLEGMAPRKNGAAIPANNSALNMCLSNVTMNGDLRKLSLTMRINSGVSLAPSMRNNNVSTEGIWVKTGENEGDTITVVEKSSKLDVRDLSRPMYRKDIFYSGSIVNLPQYNMSQRDLKAYRASVTSIPRAPTALTMAPSVPDAPSPPPETEEQPPNESYLCCGCIPIPKAMADTFSAMMDTSLLRDPIFLLICVSNVFGMLGFYVPFVYIADSAIKKGVSSDNAALLLSVIGITNTVGRIVSGWLSDRPNMNALLLNNLSLVLSGISIAVLPLAPGFVSMVLVCVAFGLFISAYVSLTSIILVDLLGLDSLTNAFGLLILFRGAASILGSPLAGALYDLTGSYDIPFFIAGGLVVFAGIISFTIPYTQRRLVASYESKIAQQGGADEAML